MAKLFTGVVNVSAGEPVPERDPVAAAPVPAGAPGTGIRRLCSPSRSRLLAGTGWHKA
jgi:hypothetical protein